MSTIYILKRRYDSERLFEQTAEAALYILNSFRPRYIYVNPLYSIYSDLLSRQLVREIDWATVDWIRRTRTTFPRRNNRRISEWASPDARTNKDKWYEKSLCRNGLYFVGGRPTNSQKWRTLCQNLPSVEVNIIRNSASHPKASSKQKKVTQDDCFALFVPEYASRSDGRTETPEEYLTNLEASFGTLEL